MDIQKIVIFIIFSVVSIFIFIGVSDIVDRTARKVGIKNSYVKHFATKSIYAQIMKWLEKVVK